LGSFLTASFVNAVRAAWASSSRRRSAGLNCLIRRLLIWSGLTKDAVPALPAVAHVRDLNADVIGVRRCRQVPTPNSAALAESFLDLVEYLSFGPTADYRFILHFGPRGFGDGEQLQEGIASERGAVATAEGASFVKLNFGVAGSGFAKARALLYLSGGLALGLVGHVAKGNSPPIVVSIPCGLHLVF